MVQRAGSESVRRIWSACGAVSLGQLVVAGPAAVILTAGLRADCIRSSERNRTTRRSSLRQRARQARRPTATSESLAGNPKRLLRAGEHHTRSIRRGLHVHHMKPASAASIWTKLPSVGKNDWLRVRSTRDQADLPGKFSAIFSGTRSRRSASSQIVVQIHSTAHCPPTRRMNFHGSIRW